jgi:hypothetical protein
VSVWGGGGRGASVAVKRRMTGAKTGEGGG